MVRLVFAFVLACALSTPVAGRSPAPKAAGGGCVGVLSHIGDTFLVKKVGITAVQNEETEAPIAAWHVDELVVGKVGAFFGKRLSVRRIKPSPAAFAAFDDPRPSRDGDADLGTLIQSAASPAGLRTLHRDHKTGRCLRQDQSDDRRPWHRAGRGPLDQECRSFCVHVVARVRRGILCSSAAKSRDVESADVHGRDARAVSRAGRFLVADFARHRAEYPAAERDACACQPKSRRNVAAVARAIADGKINKRGEAYRSRHAVSL